MGSIEQMEKWVEVIPDVCRLLIQHFSPGPITYLLPKSDQVPELITAGSSRVALRIPAHPVTLQLLNSLEFPLAAPSANPSGYVSPVSSQHVFQGLNGKIPYIIEGGSCKIGLESTIVGFQNNKVVVHRLGGISIEEIKAVCNTEVVLQLAHAQPTAPGQLKSHYATKKLLLHGDIKENMLLLTGKKIGILSFNTNYHISNSIEYVLSTNGSLSEAASGLFSAMRSLDQSDVDVILAEFFPDEGLGKSINDRLARAAYPNKYDR